MTARNDKNMRTAVIRKGDALQFSKRIYREMQRKAGSHEKDEEEREEYRYARGIETGPRIRHTYRSMSAEGSARRRAAGEKNT